MEMYQKLETAMLKMIEAELRALDGSAIINEMETKSLPDPTDIIENIGSFEDVNKLFKTLKKGSDLVESMYRSEGAYEAYQKMMDLISKFKETNKQ